MSEIKVAFQDMGSDGWVGGKVYVDSALRSLGKWQKDAAYRLKCFLLEPNEADGLAVG